MKQEKWYVAAKKADFEGIGRQFSIDPLTARMIRNRDIEGEDAIRKYLYGTLDDLYPPEAMKGIPEAVSEAAWSKCRHCDSAPDSGWLWTE